MAFSIPDARVTYLMAKEIEVAAIEGNQLYYRIWPGRS
jgi:hypothetical protein